MLTKKWFKSTRGGTKATASKDLPWFLRKKEEFQGV